MVDNHRKASKVALRMGHCMQNNSQFGLSTTRSVSSSFRLFRRLDVNVVSISMALEDFSTSKVPLFGGPVYVANSHRIVVNCILLLPDVAFHGSAGHCMLCRSRSGSACPASADSKPPAPKLRASELSCERNSFFPRHCPAMITVPSSCQPIEV